MLSKHFRLYSAQSENRQNSVSCPQYQMLDTEFFSSAYKEAEETLVADLCCKNITSSVKVIFSLLR